MESNTWNLTLPRLAIATTAAAALLLLGLLLGVPTIAWGSASPQAPEACVPGPHSGAITAAEEWCPAQNPHLVTGDVTVQNNALLTIQPGVIVRFAAGTGLYIGNLSSPGKLVADGTVAQPITFTADFSPGTPPRGFWDGIEFAANSPTNTVSYCLIEDANTGIFINDADGHIIEHCTLRHNGDAGVPGSGGAINVDGDIVTLAANEIYDNDWGVRLRKSNSNTITDNQIHANDDFGLGFVVQGGSGGDNNVLSGNRIYDNGGDGLQLDAGFNNIVAGNLIYGNGGHGAWARSQAVLQFTENVVRGNGQDGLAYDTPNFAPAALHSNVLCSNGNYDLENIWSTGLLAEGNWFGTNTPLLGVEIAGNVDFTPWISMAVAANPPVLPADGGSTSLVTLTMNGAGFTVPDGYTVTVAASQGTLAPPTLALSSGQATSTYTAGMLPGPVDIQATDLCATLTFTEVLTLQGVDLAIYKIGPGGMTWPGQTITYTIGISELNGVDARSLVIADQLPTGTTWISDTSAACGLAREVLPSQVNWTHDRWPGGTNCWFTLTVQVGAGACQEATLVNEVTVSSAAWDDDFSNNTWTTTIDSPAVACLDLAVSKDDGGGLMPILQLDKVYLITYTLTYTNEGFVDATGVVLTDSLPPGTQFYAGTGWTCGSGLCTYDVGPLPVDGPQAAPPLVVQVLTGTLTGCPDLLNEARIGDDGSNGPDFDPADNTFVLTTSLPCLPDLVLTKTDGLTECVSPGERITYTLAYTNVGLADASSVVLTETVPAHTTYAGSGWTCGAGTCTQSIGALLQGESGTAEFVVQVVGPVPGWVVTNTARIGGLEADLDPRDNEAQDTTDICLSPVDLQVTKADSGLIVGPNKEYFVEYTITVTNAGELEASGVVLTDLLPPQATYAGSGWTCGAGTCTYPVGTLVPSATVEVLLRLQLDKPALTCPVVLTNTVQAADDGSHGSDLNPADNSFTLVSTFECLPDLVVVINDNVGAATASKDGADSAWVLELLGALPEAETLAACVFPGQWITYTIAYVNTGLATATQVVLTETVPEHTSYMGYGWTCVGTTCTRAVGTLAPGAGGVAHFAVRVDTAPPDLSVEDEVRIGGAEEDLYPPDNVSSDDTPICEGLFLNIRKETNAPCAFPGDEIRYTIVFTNPSGEMARNVVLTETLPAHTSYLTTAGWLPLGGGQFAYSVGDLGPFASGTAEFVVVIDDPLPDTVTEIVNVVCMGYDGPTPPGNCYTLVTPLPLEPDLRVVKHDYVGPPPPLDAQRALDRMYRVLFNEPFRLSTTVQQWEPVRPGDIYSYTITYLNMGRRPATGVVLTETLPEYTTYVGYGWTHVGGRTYIYSVGDLAPGTGGQRNFYVQAGAVPCDGDDYLYNWVHIGGVEDECNLANNWSGEETPIECQTFVASTYLPLILKNYSEPLEPTPTPSPTPTEPPTPPPPPPPEEAYVSDVAVNAETNRVYVASPQLDAVFAVDPSGAGSVIATIPVGDGPLGLAVVTTTNKIYAANLNSWTVTAIRGSDHTPITDIYVGAQACKVAADSGDARVYATNHLESDNGAAAIDSHTDTFQYYYSRLHATQGRYGIDVDPAAEKLFIAARDAGLIAIQDAFLPDQEPQVFKLDPPRVPYVVAFNPATNHLFVTAADDNLVVVLDPYSIQWNKGKWLLWRGRWVFELDKANAGWIKEIGVGAGAEEGIAVNPLTGYVYVTNANSDTVSILRDNANPANIQWVIDLAVGEHPLGVDVDVNTNTIYVGNAGSRDLTVISGATHTVVKTIPLD